MMAREKNSVALPKDYVMTAAQAQHMGAHQ
jgi:hypothetical protein